MAVNCEGDVAVVEGNRKSRSKLLTAVGLINRVFDALSMSSLSSSYESACFFGLRSLIVVVLSSRFS